MLRLRLSCQWFSCVLCLLLCSFSCHPTMPAPQSLGSSPQGVVGGQPDLQHPAAGALLYSRNPGCSGVLIAPRVVLTAAHCVDPLPTNAHIGTALDYRMDIADPKSPKGYRSILVEMESFHIHPRWNIYDQNYRFDVGIIILKRAVTEVKPIAIHMGPMDASWIGKEILVMGYGMIHSVPSAIYPYRKYSTKLKITSVQKDRFVHYAKGKSTCHGDSGGPSLVTLNGKLQVIGLTSYGTDAKIPNGARGRCDASGVSVRVDVVRNFINAFLLRYGNAAPSCRDDKDCGLCDTCSTKKVCEQKPVSLAPATCKPCSDDKSCGGGRCAELKDGHRCLQRCLTNSCCPKGYRCDTDPSSLLNKLCVPEKGSCGSAVCQAKKDCGPGEDCLKGRCSQVLPKRFDKLCHPCWSPKDCAAPNSIVEQHVCLGSGGKGLCLQMCGSGGFCPKGFSCKLVSPGFPRQCVPDKGTFCSIPCQKSSDCPTGMACKAGQCKESRLAKENEPCEYRACEKGLECVSTVGRKWCLRPCGMPPGQVGAGCNVKNLCPKNTTCSRSGAIRFCVGSCTTSPDCKPHGGGLCVNRNCVCQKDTDCESTHRCTISGMCVPKDKFTRCPAGSGCAFRGYGDMRMFCTPLKMPGTQALGQPCDMWNRCQFGSACYFTGFRYECLEDCSKSNKCKYGGQCNIPHGGGKLCGCAKSLFPGCPCKRIGVNKALHSYCRIQNKDQPCRGGLDCPLHFVCELGKCLYKGPKKPKPEPTPEVVKEVSKEPANEKSAEPAESEVAVEKTPDAGTPETGSEKPKNEPAQPDESAEKSTVTDTSSTAQGCSCSASPVRTSFEGLAMMFLWVLAVFVLRRRRRLQ